MEKNGNKSENFRPYHAESLEQYFKFLEFLSDMRK
jgi:hypothetical protein